MSTAVPDARKSERIALRATSKQKSMLELAADIHGTSTTDFVLRAACIAAENAILDQTVFLVDDERYAQLLDAIENPPEPNDKLRSLFS